MRKLVFILFFFFTVIIAFQEETADIIIEGDALYTFSENETIEDARINCARLAIRNAIINNYTLESQNSLLVECLAPDAEILKILQEEISGNTIYLRLNVILYNDFIMDCNG